MQGGRESAAQIPSSSYSYYNKKCVYRILHPSYPVAPFQNTCHHWGSANSSPCRVRGTLISIWLSECWEQLLPVLAVPTVPDRREDMYLILMDLSRRENMYEYYPTSKKSANLFTILRLWKKSGFMTRKDLKSNAKPKSCMKRNCTKVRESNRS